MSVLNVSALTRSLGPMSKDLILKTLMDVNLSQHFLVDGTVSDRKRFPFLKINPDLKKYAKTNPDNIKDDKMVWSERYIETKTATDEYSFDPEEYRIKFSDQGVKTTAGEIPKYQETLLQITSQILVDSIISTIIWNGDTSLTTGDENLRIIDGLKKQIVALKADANSGIIIVPTGAITGGTGWGATAAPGNIQDKVALVARGLPKGVQQKGYNVYLSQNLYNKYEEDERRKHGTANYYKDADGQECMTIHGSKYKGHVLEALWMPADSNMIIATRRENLVFAHDAGLDNNLSKMTLKMGLHDTFVIGFKFVFGVGIINPYELSVNELL